MSEKCLGDLGECAHNGSCMYDCGGKPQSEADERRDEAAEIIGDMIENIKLDGLYSKESTLTFLTQVYFCLKPANPPSEDAQAPVAQGVSKSSVVALLKRIRQWDALDIPNSDGSYWKREIDAVLSGVSEPVKQPDMRAICEALGFDPTNHHNAAKCPYCRPVGGDAVRDALKIAQGLLKSYGVSHAEIDAALRIGGSGAGGAT